MAVKDHKKHFSGLNAAGVAQTPNTVSRSVKVGDRSFQTVVWQSGKAVLDSELLLHQDALQWDATLFRKWHTPSGWLRGHTHYDVYGDYVLVDGIGFADDSAGGGHIANDGTLIDALILPRLEAIVAGRMVVVEYTNTRTSAAFGNGAIGGCNLVALQPPTIYDGTDGTVKRTDFVFLEAWLALVAPSPRASGTILVASATDVAPGDLITIHNAVLTAVLVGNAANTFLVVPGDNAATATNIAAAINLNTNAVAAFVTARAYHDTVIVESIDPGAAGNATTLVVQVAVPGALTVSGPTLTGGEDRPNKPSTDQSKLYRHGNVLSPEPTWLTDDLVDTAVDVETSQRVQLQYRIRVTGSSEAVNHKKHPDGFSTLFAGPPPVPGIFAQAARNAPAADVNGRMYPFVPANNASTWGESSAAAYGIEDGGLWVAGDGTEQAAQDLGSVDGFVYAIPIGFVFRHNDVSGAQANFKGFDPTSNANGAPQYGHGGYNGPLGAIPAGKSDRPDGHFCDVITQDNLLDLRHHVSLTGIESSSELQFQIQSLLDGSLRTWALDTTSKQDLGGDSGDVSTRPLVCNEIGRSNAHGGNQVTSGDTQRGVQIRDFDHIARRFGDQSVVERVVFAFWPGDREAANPVAPGLVNAGKYVVKTGQNPVQDQWNPGDVLHLDLESLDATTLGGIFHGASGGGSSAGGLQGPTVALFAPIGTVISDVLSMYHDDGHYDASIDQHVQAALIKGIGTRHLEIALDTNPTVATYGLPLGQNNPEHPLVSTAGSTRRIFVEFEITYPMGAGTTDTPDWQVTPDSTVYDGTGIGPGPMIENDTAQRPNDHEQSQTPRFRSGYREVQLDYVCNDTTSHVGGNHHQGAPIGSLNGETLVSRNRTDLYFPRRVYGDRDDVPVVHDAVTNGVALVDSTLSEFGSSSRKVVLSANLSGLGQTQCNVEYFAQDPIPNYGVLGGGYQISVYYRSNAPQTAGVKEGSIGTTGDGVLPTTLKVEPLLMSPNVWTGQVGMGSLDQGYPYASPLEQIPINDGSPLDPNQIAGTTHEWYFCATGSIAVGDFNSDTGLIALHPMVQADVQSVLEFGGNDNARRPRKDAEFRAYYPFAADWVYRPTVLTQPLYGAVRHKVMFPFLARAVDSIAGADGGLLYRKNELLLVVMTRFAELDDENNVRFTDAENRTCAAVYRTRNLLMVVGDKMGVVPPEPGP